MEKISAVVITHNEEKNIERCLNLPLSAVEEIVVVDSFSTDAPKRSVQNLKRTYLQTQITKAVI